MSLSPSFRGSFVLYVDSHGNESPAIVTGGTDEAPNLHVFVDGLPSQVISGLKRSDTCGCATWRHFDEPAPVAAQEADTGEAVPTDPEPAPKKTKAKK